MSPDKPHPCQPANSMGPTCFFHRETLGPNQEWATSDTVRGGRAINSGESMANILLYTAYYILHTTYYYVPNMTNVSVDSVARCQFNCEVHGPVPLHGSHGILTVEPSCQTALQYFSSGACTASRRGPHAISTVSEWICLGEFW